MSTTPEALQRALYLEQFNKRVAELRQHYRSALNLPDSPTKAENHNEDAARVWVNQSRLEIDATCAALGMELGVAFSIARAAYEMPVQQMIEAVSENVFRPCGIDVAGVKVHAVSAPPGQPGGEGMPH